MLFGFNPKLPLFKSLSDSSSPNESYKIRFLLILLYFSFIISLKKDKL